MFGSFLAPFVSQPEDMTQTSLVVIQVVACTCSTAGYQTASVCLSGCLPPVDPFGNDCRHKCLGLLPYKLQSSSMTYDEWHCDSAWLQRISSKFMIIQLYLNFSFCGHGQKHKFWTVFTLRATRAIEECRGWLSVVGSPLQLALHLDSVNSTIQQICMYRGSSQQHIGVQLFLQCQIILHYFHISIFRDLFQHTFRKPRLHAEPLL